MKLYAGFIYLAPDGDPEKHYAVIPGDAVELYVYGCSTYSKACEIAKMLTKEKGCGAIELCGGFGNEGTAAVQRAVGPNIAVGAVKFDIHPGLEFKSGDIVFNK